MMKKAFTLLELVVVIIILGVLATLGFTQYGRMVERARGAEARAILGDCRKLAYAYYLANGTFSGISRANVNIGPAADQIPGPDAPNCRSSHYFTYNVIATSDTLFRVWGIRCGSGGKTPQGDSSCYLTLDVIIGVGDVWTSNCGY